MRQQFQEGSYVQVTSIKRKSDNEFNMYGLIYQICRVSKGINGRIRFALNTSFIQDEPWTWVDSEEVRWVGIYNDNESDVK